MKVLLFGEYSGFHNNLKKGLEKNGHYVKIAANGDGFKRLCSDISLGNHSTGLHGKLDRLVTPFLNFNKLKGFDVTQFINSNPITPCLINKIFINKILTHSEKNFLSCCGDDPVFYQNLDKFKYNPYSNLNLSSNLNIPKRNNYYNLTHEMMINKVDGIIPVMYEYAIGYQNHPKLKKTIPLPIDTDEIAYKDNLFKNRVHFFHGLNRPFFKGTSIIEAALTKLKDNYPNDVKITIAGNMNQKDYLTILDNANVVLDQCKGYSYGMNALYSLSKGKVVLSGSEPEALQELNIDSISCPIINIQPDINQIYEQLLEILEKRNQIKEISNDSRKFVEKFHDSKIIAQKYIQIWQR